MQMQPLSPFKRSIFYTPRILHTMNQELRGVLFRCTIRGGHASLAIIATNNVKEGDERMILVIVRLGGPDWQKQERSIQSEQSITKHKINEGGNDKMSLMRSNIRRMCKLGNEMEFRGHFAESARTTQQAANDNDVQHPTPSSTDWNAWDRFIVDYFLPLSNTASPDSMNESGNSNNVRVCRELKWDMKQCQIARAKYFPSPPKNKQQQSKKRPKSFHQNEHDVGRSHDKTNKQQSALTNEQLKQFKSRHHGGGIGKRKQGEILADFLLWMLASCHSNDYGSETQVKVEAQSSSERLDPNCDRPQSTSNESFHKENGFEQQQKKHLFMKRWVSLHPSLVPSTSKLLGSYKNHAVERNQNKMESTNNSNPAKDASTKKNHRYPFTEGIIDAAGGAGHVSLALALRGVHSTVVDPRSTVGKLPGRDRKALKKSKMPHFSTYRAWFGCRPDGVDSVFREGAATNGNNHNESITFDGNSSSDIVDPTTLPICSMCSEDNLLRDCKAIVALHPDEATGSIVETAVKHEIPFVVVPCCVFSRLFPDRIKPVVLGDEEKEEITSKNVAESVADEKNDVTVSTYFDLIDWLVAKHPAIRVTRLPFEGANIAVWATFKNEPRRLGDCTLQSMDTLPNPEVNPNSRLQIGKEA
mmetsp:Transcript_11966/g.25501  ORF Transcript_11966/g.25501 Transcript_11966/m.25501 type:complete len:643 (+) Transcript_11966:204-2132(+)